MKRAVLMGIGAALAARCVLSAIRLAPPATRKPERPKAAPGTNPLRAMEVEHDARNFLLAVGMPVWLLAGFLDYLCHRKARIEHTSGTHESVTHALMMAEASVPLLAGLFLEVNPLVLGLTAVSLAAHVATNFWDVAYAAPRREVTPNEQHTHSFLEVVPFMAASYLAVLNWHKVRDLLRGHPAPDALTLRGKDHPLPARYTGLMVVGMVVLGVAPYLEELVRCYRADRTFRPHAKRRP